jgi:hypothetical protein
VNLLTPAEWRGAQREGVVVAVVVGCCSSSARVTKGLLHGNSDDGEQSVNYRCGEGRPLFVSKEMDESAEKYLEGSERATSTSCRISRTTRRERAKASSEGD